MSEPKPKRKPRAKPASRTKAQDTTGDEPLQRWSQGTGEEPDTRDQTEGSDTDTPNDAQPVQCAKAHRERTEESQDSSTTPRANDKPDPSTAARHTPLATDDGQADRQGGVTLRSADSSGDMPAEWLELLNLARARDGETHKQCWERLRREARTAGMTRRDAISYAGRAVDHVWIAPVIPEPAHEPSPEPAPEPETLEIPAPEPEPAPTIVDKSPPADDGVPGLGDLPEDWPQLPPNASLQAEIAWVSANRLRVRDGTGVDLSRALSPAPSYSALSWLETSILFPAKFADISVKATANQDDEKEAIRREKASIEEIRGLLQEMLEDA